MRRLGAKSAEIAEIARADARAGGVGAVDVAIARARRREEFPTFALDEEGRIEQLSKDQVRWLLEWREKEARCGAEKAYEEAGGVAAVQRLRRRNSATQTLSEWGRCLPN